MSVVDPGTSELLVLRQIPEDENLEAAWDQLVEQMAPPEVFYTYEWALAVQRAYGSVLSPLLLLWYQDGALEGAAALATRQGNNQVSFLAATTADYCDFISRPERRGEFVSRALAELKQRRFGDVVLANLPSDSASVEALRTAEKRFGYRSFIRVAYTCARVVVRSSDERRQVKATLQKKISRKITTLERTGAVSLTNKTSFDEVRLELRQFEEAHIGRFLRNGRLSNQVDRARRLFLDELARLLSKKGWLCFSELRVASRPIAWNYGFRYAGSWFWYQPTFESDLDRASPGLCLLGGLVQQTCDDPNLTVMDLGLGEEEYKRRFANAERQTLHATLSTKWSHSLTAAARYHAAEFFKKRPGWESRVRSGLRGASSMAKHLHGSGALALAKRVTNRARRAVAAIDEVVFYEFCRARSAQARKEFSLVAIELSILARAAIAYDQDSGAIQYLLRSAARLRSGSAKGLALLNEEGIPLHFCWVAPFQDFQIAELGAKLDEPVPNSMMIFDCWTPVVQRGRGFYGTTIAAVAEQLAADSNRAWIFSAATNAASIRGIEKAGFERRFSLIRRHFAGISRIVKQTAAAAPVQEQLASAVGK